MTCMAAGMNDQAVKPNPVSFQGHLGLQCFAIDLMLLLLRSVLRIGGTAYTELLAKQEDPFLRFL